MADAGRARAYQVFADALDYQAGPREEFLARECNGDATFRRSGCADLAWHGRCCVNRTQDGYRALRDLYGTLGRPEDAANWNNTLVH
jgi:hypothetical protein